MIKAQKKCLSKCKNSETLNFLNEQKKVLHWLPSKINISHTGVSTRRHHLGKGGAMRGF